MISFGALIVLIMAHKNDKN
ncbi:hypothetical protein [Virgibacillus halodenitrificans]